MPTTTENTTQSVSHVNDSVNTFQNKQSDEMKTEEEFIAKDDAEMKEAAHNEHKQVSTARFLYRTVANVKGINFRRKRRMLVWLKIVV